jgi:hypothetical protein
MTVIKRTVTRERGLHLLMGGLRARAPRASQRPLPSSIELQASRRFDRGHPAGQRGRHEHPPISA